MAWLSDVTVGALAGVGATRVLDPVTTAFHERQSESSREREQELQEEMPTTRGMPSLRAGLTAALAMWLVADEILNPVLGLTPPATEYPLVSHLRGLAGHLSLGLVVGTFISIAGSWRPRKG